MDRQELQKVVDLHRKWLLQDAGGVSADLRGASLKGADLRGADLRGADLRGADLWGASLKGADLRGADLEGADLGGANLRGADLKGADLKGADLEGADLEGADLWGANLGGAGLSGADLKGAGLRGVSLQEANLGPIKADFFEVLTVARSEVLALYEALSTGKINGLVYAGECACLVGTIAKARHESPYALSIALKPNANRPAERWFLAIRAGDIPLNNPVSKITAEWMVEFMDRKGITYPRYEIRAVALVEEGVKTGGVK